MCLTLAGVVAPYVVDGPMTGAIFLAYVQQILAPSLKTGDILVLDNVAFHKVAGIREAIEARGARLLYLPPYSPDLNPIEKAFSKLKAFRPELTNGSDLRHKRTNVERRNFGAVGKHMNSVVPQFWGRVPQKLPWKLYGKPCRIGRLCGNQREEVFRCSLID